VKAMCAAHTHAHITMCVSLQGAEDTVACHVVPVVGDDDDDDGAGTMPSTSPRTVSPALVHLAQS